LYSVILPDHLFLSSANSLGVVLATTFVTYSSNLTIFFDWQSVVKCASS
jgi:hypothetical protein